MQVDLYLIESEGEPIIYRYHFPYNAGARWTIKIKVDPNIMKCGCTSKI